MDILYKGEPLSVRTAWWWVGGSSGRTDRGSPLKVSSSKTLITPLGMLPDKILIKQSVDLFKQV